MRLPGFTGDGSLYKRSRVYVCSRRSQASATKGTQLKEKEVSHEGSECWR